MLAVQRSSVRIAFKFVLWDRGAQQACIMLALQSAIVQLHFEITNLLVHFGSSIVHKVPNAVSGAWYNCVVSCKVSGSESHAGRLQQMCRCCVLTAGNMPNLNDKLHKQNDCIWTLQHPGVGVYAYTASD